MRMLFGRGAELEVGMRAFEQAALGRGQTLVLFGEPGIGKSTLARAIGDAAEAKGARVAMGRAWEVGGAPPYWPWSRALAELDLDLDALLGNATTEMAGAQRVVAFDRVTRAIAASAKERPLVILLDDVHAADTASLELALACARGIERQRVLFVATTRESELNESSRHAELVEKLAREGARISLGRLDEVAIAEWLASARFRGNAADVLRVTEGNPLFVEEAVRVGLDRLATGGVRMIGQHIARASEATRDVLSWAAIFGRECARADLVALVGDADAVARAEEEALRIDILHPSKDAWLFSHVLLRDALYQSIPFPVRADRHARAAKILTARGANAATFASHLLEATSVLDPQEIVSGVATAARAALEQHALDDAASLIDRARAKLAGKLDDGMELTFDLLLCDVKMRADPDAGRVFAQHCAERAKALGRGEDQARAAVIYGAELRSGMLDPVMIKLLEDALEVAPADNPHLRARVLTRLASAMIPPKDEATWKLARDRGEEGIAIARATKDPETLLYALRFAAAAFGYSVEATRREALVEEIVALARGRSDIFTLLHIGAFHVVILVERGEPERARIEMETFCKLVESLPLSRFHWRAPALRASLAALDAQFDEVHRLSDELKRIATQTQMTTGLHAWSLLEIALAACEGNIDRFAQHELEIRTLQARVSGFRPWIALTHALMGRLDEAKEHLQEVIAFARGFPWLIAAGQTTVLTRDREHAAFFYPLLQAEELTGRFFWGPAGAFPLGPTQRILGELALILDRKDDARAHLDRAIEQCKASQAISLLRLSERARAQLDDPPVESAPRSSLRPVKLVREADVWLVTSSSGSVRVKHSKGLEYLSTLVDSPRKEHYVLALAGAGEAPEDAGAILDDRAKTEYRARVEDLEDQIAEAERMGDPTRADRARQELDAIADQLAGALGLGGRDRKAASNVERARINVQRRIKDAIRQIAKHDAELGRYLDATVKTGTYCVYEPL